MRLNQFLDTSNELLIFKNRHGFKLVNSEKKHLKLDSFYDTGFTVADILQLPFNASFSTPEVVIQRINMQAAATLDFISTEDAIGRNISHVVQPKSAELIIQHNQSALERNQIQMFEEDIFRKDNLSLHRLSFYSPLYGNDEKIIGLFGCTIVIGHQPIDISLAKLASLGFSDSFKRLNNHLLPGSYLCGVYFTKREKQILHYLVRGFTAKNIARTINLSVRTIEDYLGNMKNKLNVSTKGELISKVMDTLLPNNLNN